jgi:SAM-dependent methyltransferase
MRVSPSRTRNTPPYRLVDLGDHRVLTVEGRDYVTEYSEHVIKMLIERKGVGRTPPYLTYKAVRGPLFLGPLFRYLRRRGVTCLRTLEVGCSFGHMTEYLHDQREVTELATFDTDPAFVSIVRAKAKELGLTKVRDIALLTGDATRRLPYSSEDFDLVVVCGVVEHLPARSRRAQVDEYYRVLARGGYLAILDTPNRWFPFETHSVGLPLIQWLTPRLAFAYARTCRPRKFGRESYEGFTMDGTGWRNATLRDCLPSSGRAGLEDLTEEAGYGWQFYRDTARSHTRRALLPIFGAGVTLVRAVGLAPSVCLPYLNLLFRKEARQSG